MCDEIINAADSVSTNVTNTIPTNMRNTLATNVISTVSTNSNDKKIRYKMHCYILHLFLLVIIVLFIITIICYHCAKLRSKQNNIGTYRMPMCAHCFSLRCE